MLGRSGTPVTLRPLHRGLGARTDGAALVDLTDGAVSFPAKAEVCGGTAHAGRRENRLHVAIGLGVNRTMAEVQGVLAGRRVIHEDVAIDQRPAV